MCSMRSRERVHPGDSEFPQFAPRDVPDLSYESFLPSQILEVDSIVDGGIIVGGGIGDPLAYWDIRPEKRDIVLEVGEKASFIIGSRMVWESRHFTI
ncbi:hypothetical protein Tco_1227993 [Tanacetum coccineum]